VVGYFAVNISSPNTPGLRELQRPEALDTLLARAMEARARASSIAGITPVLIKIAPDLTLGELDDIVGAARSGWDLRSETRAHLGRVESEILNFARMRES